MRWNKHSEVEARHAFLSPSTYHWVNYDEAKLSHRWKTIQAAARGTEEHAFAAIAIANRELQDNETTTLGLYINQCIQYKMDPEIMLYYSPNCFGTADAISFRRRLLRVHDLKTGVTKASMIQLEIYAAIFCLEYGVDPYSIRVELRIYQDGRCIPHRPDPERIKYIMDVIVKHDQQINALREEVVV